jgi:large subunit ribosomal protein L32
MPVQKSKRSRSRRGAGRAHFFITAKTHRVEKETGEFALPHRVSPMGWYNGKKIFKAKDELKAEG